MRKDVCSSVPRCCCQGLIKVAILGNPCYLLSVYICIYIYTPTMVT